MKILHTADVHIRDYNDLRWQVFGDILALGQKEKVDVLTISGDLFESSADAHRLRPKIRELFYDIDYPVLIVPGNHDIDAYSDGTFLGETVTVIQDLLKPVLIKNACFWGFPFEDMPEEEILEYLYMAGELARNYPESMTINGGDSPVRSGETVHLLLFHGELQDIAGNWEHYGTEGSKRYLPVKLSYFRELPWQYVLAGHFHSRYDVRRFGSSGYFVYPGSPIAITRREIGPRQVNLFELGKTPEPREIDAPYFDKMEIQLNPFVMDNPVHIVNEILHHLPPKAHLLLEIDGYFNGRAIGLNEIELQRALKSASGDRIDVVRMEFRDIREIIEDDLFTLFHQRLLAETIEESERDAVLNVVLQAMMESSR